MTSDLCSEDVVVRITTPQMISPESIVSASSACGSRVAASSAAVELGRRLLLAARAGDTPQVLELMAKGAPFTTDWLGTSPLHLAAGNAHLDTCAVLLRAGVSRDARTKVERTPLHLAAAGGHARVAALLLEHGAAVDVRDMLRMTPLHWAVQRGHAATAQELLAHGADAGAVSKFHKTPRSLAAELQREDLLRLIDDAVRQREAARSVHHLVTEQMAETPNPEPQVQTFDAVRRIQDIKPIKGKQQPERIMKPESKNEGSANTGVAGGVAGAVGGAAGSAGGAAGASGGAAGASGGATGASGGAAARLLRAHGITLLPADNSSTVLNALHSGRTVVLSDAGKLMLKESSETPSQPVASKSSPSAVQQNKNMVLTATPVKSPPKPGMKIFTLNNKLLALPKEGNRIPIKKIINPQDMQTKFVQLPPDAKILSPGSAAARRGGAQRPAVTIIMNRTNFDRLVANATRADEQETEQEPPGDVTVPQDDDPESTASLRTQLAAARRALASMRAELRAARARLARYESANLV